MCSISVIRLVITGEISELDYFVTCNWQYFNYMAGNFSEDHVTLKEARKRENSDTSRLAELLNEAT